MPTLEELMTRSLRYTQKKHGLADDYVESHFNAMTNMEFLQDLSEALEEWANTRFPLTARR